MDRDEMSNRNRGLSIDTSYQVSVHSSANNVGNAGPHVRQTFLNDVFTFLTEVGNAGRIVNTGTSSVNSEFVTALNT
jgi:aminoglycoside N3'-acetyltransferase